MIRDNTTKAIINNDVAALKKYKAERNQSRAIEQLRKEVDDIKEVLFRVCEKIEKIG